MRVIFFVLSFSFLHILFCPDRRVSDKYCWVVLFRRQIQDCSQCPCSAPSSLRSVFCLSQRPRFSNSDRRNTEQPYSRSTLYRGDTDSGDADRIRLPPPPLRLSWPLCTLRRFGFYGNSLFKLEAGRRAPRGEGHYLFRIRNLRGFRQYFEVSFLKWATHIKEDGYHVNHVRHIQVIWFRRHWSGSWDILYKVLIKSDHRW